jgi:hypothetical protein
MSQVIEESKEQINTSNKAVVELQPIDDSKKTLISKKKDKETLDFVIQPKRQKSLIDNADIGRFQYWKYGNLDQA